MPNARTPTEACPNQAAHTPRPTGYLAHSAWAEQMLLTHDQQECPGCHRLEIWEPLSSATMHAPAIADNSCSRCGIFYGEGDLIRTDGASGWIAFRCCPVDSLKETSVPR